MAKIIKSTTLEGKKIIRKELLAYSICTEYKRGGYKSRFEALKHQADNVNGGRRGWCSNYNKLGYLVDGGCFACYYDDQTKLLAKFYEKKKIDTWFDKDRSKIHEIYKHLLAREYDAMCIEHNKAASIPKKKAVKKTTTKKSVRKTTTAKRSCKK